MKSVSPPTDLLALENLPLDTQKKIALNLPYETIISFCKVSRKLSRICDDIYFWRNYLKVNIPERINIPPEANINWYKDKIKEYPDVKILTNLIKEGTVGIKYTKDFDSNLDIFEQVEKIISLNCENNRLTSLPCLPNLGYLNCRNNQLTSLPYLPKLVNINCLNNQLTSLPSFPNLEVLNCRNNLLTSIPYLPFLERLSCQYNELTSLPFSPKLQYLWCSNNKLTSIPSYSKLEYLDCRDNQLISLPYLLELKELYCENNRLIFLPYLPNLIYLSCQYNPLPGFKLEYWKNVWKKNR